MKVLYLSTWDFSNEESDGVCKKIYSQISVFEKNGYEVDFTYIKDEKVIYKESGVEKVLGKVGSIKKTPAYIIMYKALKDKAYDWVYNRYGMMDTFYYRVLKRLHKNGARILIEIPTYPYEGEKPKGILYQFMFWWDKIYSNRLKKVAERIITYSQDEKIFGVTTIQVMNGIDTDSIKPVHSMKNGSEIHLLMVALMQPHHGYERLLYGLRQYYDQGGTRRVFCHFVGDGPEKAVYEKIVKDCKLGEYVYFYGIKGGKELDAVYDKIDIGVCSLGGYKKGIFLSSELKAREYLAKGIPIISGIEIDIFGFIDKNSFLQLPNDESIVNINDIIKFYDEIYKESHQVVAKKIRMIAKRYIDMGAVMKSVCGYMEESIDSRIKCDV